MKYRQITNEDWISLIKVIALFVVAIGASSFIFLPDHWTLWLGIILGSIFPLVSWYIKSFGYECPKCKNQFEVSLGTELISLNGFDKKYLKCPRCEKKSWMKILAKVS